MCGCQCGLVHPQVWVCTGRAVTSRIGLDHWNQLTRVPVCRPCADEMDRLRAEFGKPVRKEGIKK